LVGATQGTRKGQLVIDFAIPKKQTNIKKGP
jgi:hypothetical protein